MTCTAEQLDPRWDWVESTTFASRDVEYLRVGCNHLEVIPVESVAGDLVAHLCLTCDAQLPAEWQLGC